MSKNNAKKRLNKARKLRSRMGSELSALENGHIHIEDVLQSPSEAMGRCRVYDVVRRAPKLGNKGAKKILQRNEVWPEDRLGSLDQSVRDRLITSLPPRARTRARGDDPQ